jgi:hypothetical protein
MSPAWWMLRTVRAVLDSSRVAEHFAEAPVFVLDEEDMDESSNPIPEAMTQTLAVDTFEVFCAPRLLDLLRSNTLSADAFFVVWEEGCCEPVR